MDDWLINKRPRWLMIPLFALWSNIHGGWIWGLLLLIAHIAGELTSQITSKERSWDDIKSLIGWSALAALAVGFNPNGLVIWLLPFQQINVSLQIQEWLSPDFHRIDFHPFLWMIFLLLLSASLQKTELVSTFQSPWFCHISLFFSTQHRAFAIVAAPILIDWMNAALQHFQWDARLKPKVQLPRPLRLFVNSLLVLTLVTSALGNAYLVSLPEQVDTNYPTAAIEWIKTNQPKGKLFNSYNWGGYLLWTLPEYLVFIDGRADLYGNEMISQWQTVVNQQENAFEILDYWDANIILIEPFWEITKILESNGWQKVLKMKSLLFI
ncbi:MAG: hypothetical protein HC797_09275 [Anaerolineales bacterium]|nr:hypothetical protein [Anaerolineales bacterium]